MKLVFQYVLELVFGKKFFIIGEVYIWVKECFDLLLLRGSYLNFFVKCIIFLDISRKSCQKIRVVGKIINFIFNYIMVYDGFRFEDLMEVCVEFIVWDYYKLIN